MKLITQLENRLNGWITHNYDLEGLIIVDSVKFFHGRGMQYIVGFMSESF